MTRDDRLTICARLPGAVEDYPFGEDVAVFKLGGRVFALVALTGEPGSVNLKCDPELAVALRSRYPAVRPGCTRTSVTGTPSTSTGRLPIPNAGK